MSSHGVILQRDKVAIVNSVEEEKKLSKASASIFLAGFAKLFLTSFTLGK